MRKFTVTCGLIPMPAANKASKHLPLGQAIVIGLQDFYSGRNKEYYYTIRVMVIVNISETLWQIISQSITSYNALHVSACCPQHTSRERRGLVSSMAEPWHALWQGPHGLWL